LPVLPSSIRRSDYPTYGAADGADPHGNGAIGRWHPGDTPSTFVTALADPLRWTVGAAEAQRNGSLPRRFRVGAVPGRRKEVRQVKNFLRRAWYSPALLVILVYVLGAPRKWPKG
jgi:hypothetical protein